MIDSLLKVLTGVVAVKLLGTKDDPQTPLAALDTQPLDDLARQAPGASTAIASEAAASVPVEPAPSTPTIAPSTPTVPSHWAPVPSTPSTPSAPAAVASEAAASVPVAPSPVEDTSELAGALESARAAAERLYSYIMRTSSTNRDRTLIRSLQAAMGSVTVDGLIGRETAARIRELTGRRIAGLS